MHPLTRVFSHHTRDRMTVDDASFFAGLTANMRKRGYRDDMEVVRPPFRIGAQAYVDLRFAPGLGDPEPHDTQAIVESVASGHDIDWPKVEADEHGNMRVPIRNREDLIPLRSAKAIPSGFKDIGTGLFRKAGDEHHMWKLECDDGGEYSLVRQHEERSEPVFADIPSIEAQKHLAKASPRFAIGAEVYTPDGIGLVAGEDRHGQVIIDFNGTQLPYRAQHLQPVQREAQVVADPPSGDLDIGPPSQRRNPRGYDQDGERAWLSNFYTQVYGNSAFADEAVKAFDK